MVIDRVFVFILVIYGISTTLPTHSHCHRFLSQSPKRQEAALFRFFSHKRDKSRAENQHQDVKEGVRPKAIFHDLYVKKKSGVRNGENPVVVAGHVTNVQNRN